MCGKHVTLWQIHWTFVVPYTVDNAHSLWQLDGKSKLRGWELPRGSVNLL